MSQFFKRILPEHTYNKIRNALVFDPLDPNQLWQQVPQRYVEGLGVERIKGYRYPAPGSQPAAVVPARESIDRLYNNRYFTRTASKTAPFEILLNTSAGFLSVPLAPKVMQPVRKNQPSFAYDPTGLRTPRSITNEAVLKEIAKAQPDHLPRPQWFNDREEMRKECERKGIPERAGRPLKNKLPDLYFQHRI